MHKQPNTTVMFNPRILRGMIKLFYRICHQNPVDTLLCLCSSVVATVTERMFLFFHPKRPSLQETKRRLPD